MKHFTTALIALILCSVATAQLVCPQDDGFEAGCCVPISQPNLPQFPAFNVAGLYGCLKDCNLEAQFQTNIQLSAPAFIACDLALINITVSGGGVGPNFSGVIIAKYVRTWAEFPNTTNSGRQVWRFLINTDANFIATAASAAPCPIPLAALPPINQPIHMVGSIEYARDCQPNPTVPPFSMSLNLTHVGCLNHEFFSQRPLTGPAAAVDRVYSLVSPINFVFGAVPEPEGPLAGDSVRSSQLVLGAPYQCFGEARIGQGGIQTQFRDCFTCGTPVPGLSAAWAHQTFNGLAFCNGLASPINTVAVAPWFPTGLMALSLGNWTGIVNTTFPGLRTLHVYYGILTYNDLCGNGFPIHLVTGVGNNRTDDTVLLSNPLGIVVNENVDLQNMLVFDPANGALVPGIGAPFLPDIVWSLNTF